MWMFRRPASAHEVGNRCFAVAHCLLRPLVAARVAATVAVAFSSVSLEVNGFGIIAGPDGNVWITSYGEISGITPDGSQVNVSRCAPNCVPAKITTGPDGRIYYLDQVRHVIGRIS